MAISLDEIEELLRRAYRFMRHPRDLATIVGAWLIATGVAAIVCVPGYRWRSAIITLVVLVIFFFVVRQLRKLEEEKREKLHAQFEERLLDRVCMLVTRGMWNDADRRLEVEVLLYTPASSPRTLTAMTNEPLSVVVQLQESLTAQFCLFEEHTRASVRVLPEGCSCTFVSRDKNMLAPKSMVQRCTFCLEGANYEATCEKELSF